MANWQSVSFDGKTEKAKDTVAKVLEEAKASEKFEGFDITDRTVMIYASNNFNMRPYTMALAKRIKEELSPGEQVEATWRYAHEPQESIYIVKN